MKGAFARLKTSDELSDTLPLLSYLGITYNKNEVVQDVLDWFDEEIDFLNYGNPMQEIRMAISKSEDVKRLMLQMIQEMDLDIVDFRVEEKENENGEKEMVEVEPAKEKVKIKKRPVSLSDIHPLWTKHPNECSDEDYLNFYRKVFMDYKEPL